MNKKRLLLWSLYDFANSIVFINFLLYFSQWLVIEGGLSDFWYNATFAISTVLLFFSAPVLAAYTDEHGGRRYFLNVSTVCVATSYAAAVVSALSAFHIAITAVFFLLGQYFYQLSFVFYNPMIVEIADVAHRTRVSGVGQSANALGQVVGLLIMLPLAGSRLAPLLPSVGLFVVLAFPMMLLYDGARPRTARVGNLAVPEEMRRFLREGARFFAASTAAPLLLAFFLYNDALVTVTNNYAIYVERVFAAPDAVKSGLLLAIVVMNGVGALLAGWVGDRIGPFRTLKLVLVGWVIALPVIAVTSNIAGFAAMTVCLGVLIGAMWATSRAYLSTLLSSENMGFGFSFYTVFERLSSFFGPLTWGGVIGMLGTESSSYRVAMATMAAFVVLGLSVLVLWKREPQELRNQP
jgi:UMF1 family MFS transporter